MFAVQPALPVDAEQIREIATQCEIDAWTVSQYRDEAKHKSALLLKAVDESGRILGFVSGRVVAGSVSEFDGEIFGIAVLPPHRGWGIGRVLLDKAKNHFAAREAEFVWLEVRRSNFQAIKFYENNGFTGAAVRNNFYSRPTEDAIVMKLTIGTNLGRTPA